MPREVDLEDEEAGTADERLMESTAALLGALAQVCGPQAFEPQSSPLFQRDGLRAFSRRSGSVDRQDRCWRLILTDFGDFWVVSNFDTKSQLPSVASSSASFFLPEAFSFVPSFTFSYHLSDSIAPSR